MDKSESSHVTNKNRIVRSNIENPASAKSSGSFWSKLLLQKRKGLHILPTKGATLCCL